MNVIGTISDSFEVTLTDSNLHEISFDMIEVMSDSLIEDDLLKDIPVFGTILKLSKFGLTLRDHLFVKKLIYFFKEFSDIEPDKRKKMIDLIDESKEQTSKVGEKLLYIIDKCEDHRVSDYVGKVFKLFLQGKLSYSEFLRGTSILQSIFLPDFEFFLTSNYNGRSINSYNESFAESESNLVNSGLCGKYLEPFRVEDETDSDMGRKYAVDGGEEAIYVTPFGEKLRELLLAI